MPSQAILIGEPLARFLATGSVSRVIAHFDSTLQLEADDGQRWAVTTHANPGAFRIVVPTLPDCNVGQRFNLSYETYTIWNPRPHRRTLTQAEKQSTGRTLASQLSTTCVAETHGAWEIVADHWSSIAHALRECDEPSLQETMKMLIGCGTGLTPTGDDFVQALLVTLQSGDTNDRLAFAALSRTITPLLNRTTQLSRAFLNEALHGWACGPLKGLLDELPKVSELRVETLLLVGATSGTALALGVLMGLMYEFD